MEKEKLNLSEIKFVNFPANQYVREETKKTQIVLHHTVSGKGVEGDINWWLKDPKRIATHFIINWDGTIYQNYSSKYWGYHLGEVTSTFHKLGLNYQRHDMNTIAIEIDSWGGLSKKEGKYYHAYGREVSEDIVYTLDKPFRGFRFFEKYTEKQIESVRNLIVYFNEKYQIPLTYSETWDISKDALSGKPGIYYHTNYREDKSDVFPYPPLINMLKNLKNV